MKTVLVTGSSGFIGKNLVARLNTIEEISVLQFNRSHNEKELKDHINQADFIFHLAGINRPEDDSEFDKGNALLTEKIVGLLNKKKEPAPLLVTSSIQAERDNPYGISKKKVEDIAFNYARDNDVDVYVYRLPNVFGKWCRPNYNSVVATFCHNIARNLPITINDPSAELSLVYIDDVVSSFIAALNGQVKGSKGGFCHVPSSQTITLQELADMLYKFRASRETLVMPNLESDLTRNLYATYTSYFPENDFDYKLKTNTDERGWLSEFIKSEQFGQIFISKTKPGISRGNHWHNTKIEKFLVVDGEAEITFRKLKTDEIIRYTVKGEDLRVLDIPAGYVHAIKNTGPNDLITIFWADEILNPTNPDTIFEKVEKEVST